VVLFKLLHQVVTLRVAVEVVLTTSLVVYQLLVLEEAVKAEMTQLVQQPMQL
jgi:hypothetical protein